MALTIDALKTRRWSGLTLEELAAIWRRHQLDEPNLYDNLAAEYKRTRGAMAQVLTVLRAVDRGMAAAPWVAKASIAKLSAEEQAYVFGRPWHEPAQPELPAAEPPVTWIHEGDRVADALERIAEAQECISDATERIAGLLERLLNVTMAAWGNPAPPAIEEEAE